jgi:hypothetical protein
VVADGDFEDWEGGREVLAAVRAAGFTLTPAQLARRHRAGLIAEPEVRHLGYGRGTISLYPPGTAERLIRILELGGRGESFEDVGWRVWWRDGGELSPLVRRRLRDEAARWEGELSKLADLLEREEAGEEEAELEMDRTYEAAGRDRMPASLGRVRRNVGREDFATVFRVLADVASGRFREFRDEESELLVERALGIDRARADCLYDGEPWFEGSSAEDLGRLSSAVGQQCLSELADADAVDLDTARRELGDLWEIVLAIAPIFKELGGSGAFGFDTVGAVFAAQPERNQPFLLLMWLFLRQDPRLRRGMATLKAVREEALAARQTFALIAALREEVPAFAEMMSRESLGSALQDEESREALNAKLSALFEAERVAVERFVERHPELAPPLPPSITSRPR